MNRFAHICFVLIAFALGACSKPAAQPVQSTVSETATQSYSVKGILRAINFADQSVTVEHEEIPDYMPAMTMPFDVKSMAEVQPLKVGDGIKFRLVVTDKSSWIEGIEKIDAAQVKVTPKRAAIVANSTMAERLKEGDRLPEFQLVDHNGQQITRETFAGKPLFITFIFTRCPIPNFCPLMSRNFVEIQKALAGGSKKDEVQYLSISFDPEFDTPEILTNYAKQYHADGKQWRFATGSPDQIKQLTQAFSVYVQPEQGTISHGLATALVRPDGVIEKIFRGNSWPASDAVEAVNSL
ncbi:SCO family protein [Verrucomicrobiota bacterium sgz303538]